MRTFCKLKLRGSALDCPSLSRCLRWTYLRWPPCSILRRVCYGHIISRKLQASRIRYCVNHLACRSRATSACVPFMAKTDRFNSCNTAATNQLSCPEPGHIPVAMS